MSFLVVCGGIYIAFAVLGAAIDNSALTSFCCISAAILLYLDKKNKDGDNDG